MRTLFIVSLVVNAMFVTGITALLVAENRALNEVQKILLADDAGFEEKLKKANLDFSSKGIRKCFFEYIHYSIFIYPYQTCFVSNRSIINPKDSFYSFVYQKPVSRFRMLFRGDSQKNLYFADGTARMKNRLKKVYEDGRIIDSRGMN